MRLLGVDTGGTFTDFVYFDGDGLSIHKVLSTPEAPERAVMQGIEEMNIDVRGLQLIHGSTVATNALLEGKTAVSAYVANRGLADVLTIGRQARDDIYSLTPVAPKPPVPESLCFETNARTSATGETISGLEADDLERLVKQLSRGDIEAVAINLLFSFVDPRFERAIADALPDRLFVSCSHEVLPEYGEYERGIATWINASLGPIMHRYIGKLGQNLPDTLLTVMQSSAGTVAAAEAERMAVHLLLSGPAGGLIGAGAIGAVAGRDRLLSFDMGGTSTDVALIDGDIRLTRESRIGRYPVAVPMVDMHTIGAGGGSIARVDAGGLLQVGPESAGANPGPACYGFGGEEATVTDANVVLGRLPVSSALGGDMHLDISAAVKAIDALAAKMKLSREQAAEGVIRLANEHMTQALRVISVQRGIDIRDFTLLSFGGAGGLHVCALAELMGMSRALVPVHSGVLSALGMLMAPRQRVLTRTLAAPLRRFSIAEVNDGLQELMRSGRRKMTAEGIEPSSIVERYSLDLRYEGQSYSLEIPWLNDIDGAERDFHGTHRQRYGHDLRLKVELVNLRVQLQSPPPKVSLPEHRAVDRTETGKVKVYGYDGAVPCLQRHALDRGETIKGPAIILESTATTFVERGWTVEIDAYGNLLLEKE